MNKISYRKNQNWKSKILLISIDINEDFSILIKKELNQQETLLKSQHLDIIDLSILNELIFQGKIYYKVVVNYAIIENKNMLVYE